MKKEKKVIYLLPMVLICSVRADITDAGLNIGSGNVSSQNVNRSKFTQDKSPSTYNFKMDH